MSGDLADGMLAMVGHEPPAQDDAAVLAAIVKRRAVDPADAAMLLEALGLAGGSSGAWIGHATRPVSYVHGTQSGVDHHLDAGHASLCGACQRFVDVKEKRGVGCGPGCASVTGYWRHRNANEPTCQASRDAYRVHKRERAARGPVGR